METPDLFKSTGEDMHRIAGFQNFYSVLLCNKI